MMQLENVVGQTQQRPFHFNLNGTAEQEATKAHVFLDHGEDALGLDAAVDADQLASVVLMRSSISARCLAKRLET